MRSDVCKRHKMMRDRRINFEIIQGLHNARSNDS